MAFGALTLLAAGAPAFAVQVALLVPLGAASVTFAAGVNSTLQLAAEPAMRGRVMALYSVVFLGSTPVGAPLVGWVAETAGPRAGLMVGGAAALVTGAVAAWWRHDVRRDPGRALDDDRSHEPLGARARGGHPVGRADVAGGRRGAHREAGGVPAAHGRDRRPLLRGRARSR
jgi:MFS family permease